MKKIGKKQLNLNKEVIASLSEDNLGQIKGGKGTGTFNSECICVTRYERTCPYYTQNGCQVEVTNSHADICCEIKDSKNMCIIPATLKEGCIKVQTDICITTDIRQTKGC